MVFPKVLAIMLGYCNHFPNYPIKCLRMYNAQELRSQFFYDYCTTAGIFFKCYVFYEYSQNGLAKVFIKNIQLVTIPLFLYANFPSSFWGHVVLHPAALLRLRPTLLNI